MTSRSAQPAATPALIPLLSQCKLNKSKKTTLFPVRSYTVFSNLVLLNSQITCRMERKSSENGSGGPQTVEKAEKLEDGSFMLQILMMNETEQEKKRQFLHAQQHKYSSQ